MRTLAQKVIEEAYLKNGMTVSILVLPAIETNLPEFLVTEESPVRIDLLANRPINLTMDESGLQVDLCFSGPPITCKFGWHHILMVMYGDITIPTTILVPKVLMENENIRDRQEEEKKKPFKPTLRIVK